MKLLNSLNNSFFYIGSIFVLLGNVIYCIFRKGVRFSLLYKQLVAIGLNSFFLVFLTSFFTGIVIALQSAYQMERLSAEIYVSSLVALSMVRELGPVITGLVVAGKTGASISAEIATMKVTEQVDALESLATSPIEYLIVPRFMALIISLPILAMYSNFIGMFGGFIIGTTKLGIGSSQYIRLTIEALRLKDVYSGLMKSFVFGFIISLISSHEGLNALGGAEGVGRSTTRTVVLSFILIIAADCLLTALFYFLLP
jgi:phospholipid/cholesterol/gamma-HCH transport system permease protein